MINLASRRLAYLAGPYNSGYLNRKDNIHNARLMTRYAWLRGYIPINPITNFMDLESYVVDERISEREILYSCLRLVNVCDLILVSPNGRSSTGALIEMMLAHAADKPIIYTHVNEVMMTTGEIFITKGNGGKSETQSTSRRGNQYTGQGTTLRR